jgi:hypothetical protein
MKLNVFDDDDDSKSDDENNDDSGKEANKAVGNDDDDDDEIIQGLSKFSLDPEAHQAEAEYTSKGPIFRSGANLPYIRMDIFEVHLFILCKFRT